MNYAFVCTNYNNAHFTEIAVETLNACLVPPTLIVVVDNQSDAPGRAALTTLASHHGNVEIIHNAENVGYFRGLNVGIQRVRERDPSLTCMVVGNNDLEFPKDFGNRLADAIGDASDRPVISPYIETLDGIPQNPHVVSGISRFRELVYDVYYSHYHLSRVVRAIAHRAGRFADRDDEHKYPEPGFIYQGHGSCYVLTPAFFAEFDDLWAPTFLMGEEYFLSRQLSGRGFMVYYDPRVRLRHRCNGSIENVPARKMWGLARDAHRVYRRYVKPWHRQAHGIHRKSTDA